MKRVVLLYQAAPRFGGWVTFTAHLHKSLSECGYEPVLLKVGKSFEQRSRDFGYGISYQNVNREAISSMRFPTIVTAVGHDQSDSIGEWLPKRSLLVVHDPTEMKGGLVGAIRHSEASVVSIRRKNVQNLSALGVDSTFIPHPYSAVPIEPKVERKMNAISLSRLDWDKNIDIIVGANAQLPPELRVQIYGFENSMYTYNKLTNAFPNWKSEYRGRFGRAWGEAFRLAGQARYVVDMSLIKGDGGGTQYTFLEAWDAGAALVVHRKWLIPNDDLVEGKNTLAAGSPGELKEILTRSVNPSLIENGRASLAAHAPTAVVPSYEALWS